ncbi:sensor histidine kinase [Cryptosporangium phraense]|uniref:histidine kinase n=1 Tax=Cryptosporangium phraense TaxID=2593070 RepID=A0A545AXN2_9ACTN|nr:histidine kinase [Cryptosporangium phraense]TQS45355.1 sensor histidine kinase [Cryptosporangium phraense]
MFRLLRSAWDEPRPPDVPRRTRRDYALVAAFALAVLAEAAARSTLENRGATTAIALALLPALLIRRDHPLASVVIAFGITGLAAPVIGGEPRLSAMVYLLFLPYALYRWGSGAQIVVGSAVVLAKLASSLLVADFGPTEAGQGLAVLVATAALATAFRYRASARTRELARARSFEREQLARDLHDTVAHHVSAIAVRAQAGIAVPEAAVETLRVIEAEASRTLAEMRAIVRTLRDDEVADRAPLPGLPDVAGLADRRADPPVDVELADVSTIPTPVATALYRLAQESVTNARRHARRATRIEVRVTADDTSVHLRVHDDGEPATANGTGYGLRGMAERAALLGGSCEAGPDPERGWTVTARLPRA